MADFSDPHSDCDPEHTVPCMTSREELHSGGFFDFSTPWMDLTARNLADGKAHYSDYDAWETWMSRFMEHECDATCRKDRPCYACNLYNWWEETDILVRPHLYSAMVLACESTARAHGWEPRK